jgi:hypothetical protein
MYYMHQDLPFSKENVSINDTSQGCPPNLRYNSLHHAESLLRRRPTCDGMHVYELNDSIQEFT